MRSIPRVRAVLKARKPSTRCSSTCKGWGVFMASMGREIEYCIECNSNQPKRLQVTGDEVSRLPEARRALLKECGAARYALSEDEVAALEECLVALADPESNLLEQDRLRELCDLAWWAASGFRRGKLP